MKAYWKGTGRMGNLLAYQGKLPVVGEDVFIAPGAVLVGDIVIGKGSSIWYNAVLRADVNRIRIGCYTNIQDNCTVHEDSGRGSGREGGLPTIIGDYVTVGHNSIVHACTVEDYCLIGMGAILLDGSVIGTGSVIGAGAVVTKNMVIPPFSVVLGIPGKIVKTLGESHLPARKEQAEHYYRVAMRHMGK